MLSIQEVWFRIPGVFLSVGVDHASHGLLMSEVPLFLSSSEVLLCLSSSEVPLCLSSSEVPLYRGCLAHKKAPPRRTIQWCDAFSPMVVQGRGGVLISEVPLKRAIKKKQVDSLETHWEQ